MYILATFYIITVNLQRPRNKLGRNSRPAYYVLAYVPGELRQIYRWKINGISIMMLFYGIILRRFRYDQNWNDHFFFFLTNIIKFHVAKLFLR